MSLRILKSLSGFPIPQKLCLLMTNHFSVPCTDESRHHAFLHKYFLSMLKKSSVSYHPCECDIVHYIFQYLKKENRARIYKLYGAQKINSTGLCGLAGGIDSLEPIPGIHKSLQLRAQFVSFSIVRNSWCHNRFFSS
jgi:hypothetical protein